MPVEKPEQNKVNTRLQKEAIVKEIKKAVYGESGNANSLELVTLFDEELAAQPIDKTGLRDVLFKLKYLPDLQRKMQQEKLFRHQTIDAVLI